jgi:hypothetical protein
MPAAKNEYSSAEFFEFLDPRREHLMAILTSYWDESGKFEDQKVVSFCGVCLSRSKIESFEEDWSELLRRNGLSYLKVSDALKADRKLSAIIPAQTVGERIEALKPFVSCLAERFELGVAIAVNVEAFKRTKEHIKKKIAGGEDPFYFAFLTAIAHFVNYRQEDDRIAVVFDDDEKTASRCLALYRRMKIIDADYRAALASITFADDQAYKPLQAADLLAGLVRLQCDFQFSDRSYDYQSLFEHLAEDRGPRFIQWRIAFVGEQKMAKIELGWKREMRQNPCL